MACLNKQVKFLRSLMDSINIGTEAVQYGVTVFASSAKTLLPISADASKFDALAMADADRASWGVGERTFMGQGFDNARAMLASSPRNVAKVCVLITDGKPSDNVQPTDLRTNTLQPSPAQVAANALKDNGYAVMALLIGDGVTKTDVGSFVTEAPIQIASFSALALAVTAVNTKLSATLCAEEKKVTLAPTKPVRPVAGWPSTCGKADVAFVVDASSSINTTSCPARVSSCAAIRPAGPPPITSAADTEQPGACAVAG